MHLEVFKQEKSYDCCFRRLSDSRKGTANAFNCYRLTSKVCLVYLQVKMQQRSSGQCIRQLKCHKNGTNKVFTGKQATIKVPLLFLDVKMVTGDTTNICKRYIKQ